MITRFRPKSNHKDTRIAPSEIRDQRSLREGLSSPTLAVVSSDLHAEVWQILDGGVASLPDNDHGRPWPRPNGATIARTLREHPADLCLSAAREAREIVQAQDRAPNITGLFEKKLRELAEIRSTVRESLEVV